VPSSCAQLGGFAIGALVSLLYSRIHRKCIQRPTRNVSECLYSLYAWANHICQTHSMLPWSCQCHFQLFCWLCAHVRRPPLSPPQSSIPGTTDLPIHQKKKQKPKSREIVTAVFFCQKPTETDQQCKLWHVTTLTETIISVSLWPMKLNKYFTISLCLSPCVSHILRFTGSTRGA